MLFDTIIRPVKDDLPRKWIADDFFDLIVWYEGDTIAGFQLCYDKPYEQHAFTWQQNGGSSHAQIDTGEDTPTANRTPILIADGPFPQARIVMEFRNRSQMLPREIRETVLEKLAAYPAQNPVT